MNVKQEILLKEYLKGKRNYSVNMTEDYVRWKDECHNIVYKNDIPYVQIKEIFSLMELRHMVQTVCQKDNKEKLKGLFITIKDSTYHIIGIGGESIKASKNGKKAEFYRYIGTQKKNLEAQELLEKLYSMCDDNEIKISE